jgi:ATP-dependent protease Clp ATPase subunit
VYVAAECRSADAANDDENIVEIDKSNVLLMGPTGSGLFSSNKEYPSYLYVYLTHVEPE